MLFIFLLIWFTSCSQAEKTVEVPAKKSFEFPVLVDTFQYLVTAEDSARLRNGSYYGPGFIYYIGPVTDTIFLQPNPHLGRPPLPSDVVIPGVRQIFTYPVNFPFFKKYEREYSEKYFHHHEDDFEIILDTVNRLSDFFVPVYIINRSWDTVRVGEDRRVNLETEARDSSGTWMCLKWKIISDCATGSKDYILPPGECVVTMSPVFQGDYRTQMRFHLMGCISSSFEGNMDYGRLKMGEKRN